MLLNFDANKNFSVPVFCPLCQSGVSPVTDEPAPVVRATRPLVREQKFALLTLVADVSGSMFENIEATGSGSTQRIVQVTDSLAQVLWDLSMPEAGTSKSLLIAPLAFGNRAVWLDARGERVEASNEPIMLSSSELAQRLATIGGQGDRRQKNDFIAAMRKALADAFQLASDVCGPGTNYEIALARCQALLERVQDKGNRHALRPSWDAVLKDPDGLTFLRTVFYTDGAPTAGSVNVAELEGLCRRIFASEGVILMGSSFVGAVDQPEVAEALLKEMSSVCPKHKNDRCMFPGEISRYFRDILRMASEGVGYCPRCMSKRG